MDSLRHRPPAPPCPDAWSRHGEEVLEALRVTPATGLSEAEVRERRRRYGPNRRQEPPQTSLVELVLNQFKSLIVVLLAAAMGVSFAFGDIIEGSAIAAVIFINAAIGLITEWRAVRSMEALRRLTQSQAKVRREGRLRNVAAEELVPGDIVVLEGGDIVGADLRVLQASKLQANESALTGESAPVGKSTAAVHLNAPVSERRGMLFQGTTVTRGSGEGVVVATGMASELGEIAGLVAEAKEASTPLEKRLDRLARKLVWITLGIAAVMALSGTLAGKDVYLMIETSIALAVAAIPEGLPIVATMALARGMWRMARRNVLVNRLSAVETLGATGIVRTDKTGTLTENRLSVILYAFEHGDVEVAPNDERERHDMPFVREGSTVDPSQDPVLRRALEIGALCNNAAISEQEDRETNPVGDPLEVALLRVAALANLRRLDLVSGQPEEREEAFDPDIKMMATFHRQNNGFRVAVKGAAEAVLRASTRLLAEEGERELTETDRRRWRQRNAQMAEDGLRVLALAEKTASTCEVGPYDNLRFVGLVGLLDPPREDVRESIGRCRQAGIRVIMVTGDQPATAVHVARAVGLLDQTGDANVVAGSELEHVEQLSQSEIDRMREATLFARVSPKQKLSLISLHQRSGAIVAMTGDGVNDAPALRKADIGVAMGQRGTEVAREASDMILKDDAFSSIVAAVRHGRVIFDNIRRFVIYLMSCNLSEILVVGVASVAQMPLPILPLQILFLNLVTDVFPALALGMGEGDEQVMRRPPRPPQEAVLTKRHWRTIGAYGVLITATVLVAFDLALRHMEMTEREAVTVSFLVLAFAQVWHVFNLRARGTTPWRNDVVGNPYVWGAIGLCVGLLLAAVYLPGLSDVLRVTPPSAAGWLLVIGLSLVPLIVGQIIQSFPSGMHPLPKTTGCCQTRGALWTL